MRLTRILLAASVLALVALPGFAAAHNSHSPCPASQTLLPTLAIAHVDVWWKSNPCLGVVVSSDNVECAGGVHQHAAGLHVLVLNGHGCQTGAILEKPTIEGGVLP